MRSGDGTAQIRGQAQGRKNIEQAPSEGSHRFGLTSATWVAVAVGALWRIGVLVERWNNDLLFNDSLYYSGQAIQLADGTFFREVFADRPGAEHGPLTSTLLALVSWVDQPVPWQRLVTTILGIATVVVIALLARAVAGDRVAVVAAAIAAVYPNLWMNDGLVMSESLSLLLVSLILLVGVRVLRTPTIRLAATLGVLAGLAALSRSELVLFAPGLAILLWLADRANPRRWAAPGVLLAGAMVVMLPWVAFNVARFEKLVTLTTNDGTTLLGSYCAETFSGDHKGGWSLACVVNDPQYAVDEEPSVRSARQRSLARQYATEHLGALPGVMVARLARTADLYDLGNLVHQDVGEERYRWASWAGIVSWWLLALLALLGLRRTDRVALRVFALPCIMVFLVTIVFYGAHRIRSPMEPVVVVLAAIGLGTSYDRLRHRD